jgi:outer membrane protein assembly factor BamE
MKAIVILSFILLSACAVPQSRIRQEYIYQNLDLPNEVAWAVLEGQIVKGMTKDDVRASWGIPCGYCPGTRENSWGDTWEYNVFGTAYGIGTLVFFDKNGRVSGWSK